MANNKRGHRRGKKKDPADTPEATASLPNIEAADTVQTSETGPPTDTVPPTNTVQSTRTVQPIDTVQAAAMASNEDSKHTEAPCTACGYYETQLKEAKQKISDLEAREYQHEQSREQSKKAQKKTVSGYEAHIKEISGHNDQLVEAFESEREARVAAEKQVEIQKSKSETVDTKHKESEGRLAATVLELHKTTADRDTLNLKITRLNDENKKLEGRIAVLVDDQQKRDGADAAIVEAANTLMDEQHGAQDDAMRMEDAFQSQREELEELKRQNKELQSFRRRTIGSEDGSDVEPYPLSRRRRQQPRALSQELDGMLSDGDVESTNDPKLELPSPTRSAEANSGQWLPNESARSLIPQTSPHHGETAAFQSRPYQGLRSTPSFLPSLKLHNVPEWPHGVGHQVHGVRYQSDSTTQTDESTDQANEVRPQADGITYTEKLANQGHRIRAGADVSTQKDKLVHKAYERHSLADRSTQTNKPQSAARAATQPSEDSKVPLLQRPGYHHWFFTIAACLLLLLTLFAFYHGFQARAERAMWLAANDCSRRAVIYHRNASVRGDWLGWLTTTKMRDLSVGAGSGFGKYGVEM